MQDRNVALFFLLRSIVDGIQAFRRGHILRVGNERSIDIWMDHWVSGMMSRKIETNRGQVLLRTIDPITGSWDEIQN
jgi:hypothetical protein